MLMFRVKVFPDEEEANDLFVQGLVKVTCPTCQVPAFLFKERFTAKCTVCDSQLYLQHDVVINKLIGRIDYHARGIVKNDLLMRVAFKEHLKNIGSLERADDPH